MYIQITKEKIGYSAYIKEYRIHTQGDTFEELIINIQDALKENGYENSSFNIDNKKNNNLSPKINFNHFCLNF